ncbi:MAG TPA: acyl-CoA dehydrogenase, partial [Acidimicrobiia bacterium]|nr:acyl-CoA dehydrogenase [Acidimicrobiia bacterium]
MSDELRAAAAAVDVAGTVVNTAVRRLAELSAESGKLSVPALDRHQAIAYDLAHAAAAVEGSRVMCTYGDHGEVESMLARAYVADAVHDVASRALGRSQVWGIERDALATAMPFVSEHRAPEFLETLAD